MIERLDKILCHYKTTDNKHITRGMGETHFLIAQGAIKINGNRITDVDYIVSDKNFIDGAMVLTIRRNHIFIMYQNGQIVKKETI